MKQSRFFKATIIALACVAVLWAVDLKTACVPRAAATLAGYILRGSPAPVSGGESAGSADVNEVLRRAEGLLDQHNDQGAAHILERCIQFHPRDSRARSLLGGAYFLLGRDEDAVTAYEKAIEISPDDFQAHRMLGTIYSIQGRIDKAVEAYTHAAALGPSDPNILLELGTVYEDANQPSQAFRQYEMALRLDPNFVDAHLRSGFVYNGLDEYEKAIPAFQTVVRLKPDCADAYRGLGWAYYRMRDLECARVQYEEVIRLKAGVPDPYTEIMRACRKLTRDSGSLKSASGAPAAGGANVHGVVPEARFLLGAIYYELGNEDLALKEFQLLKDMDAELADELLKYVQTDCNRRNLSTPSGRLAGHWRSIGGDESIYSTPDPSLGTGVCKMQSKSENSVFRFRVVSEDASGTNLVIRNFNDVWAAQMKIVSGLDLFQSDVVCSIPKDGRRMTQEFSCGDMRFLTVYEYVPAYGWSVSEATGLRDTASNGGNRNSSAGSGPRVEAIMRGTDGRLLALVGDGLVPEGTIVQGYRVQNIRTDSVEFEKDGKTWVQKID